MTQDDDTLSITSSDPDGAAGIDDDPHNPLARALHRLLHEGKPFDRFHVCHFNPLPLSAGMKWFGVFVVSAGQRLVYFPGMAEEYRYTHTSKGQGRITPRAFRLDHLSLDPLRDHWHMTTHKSKQHLGSYRTNELGDGRILWFGMSIANPSVMRTAKTRTVACFQVPRRDALRRGEIFKKAREGVVFNTIGFNQTNRQLVVPNFVHFGLVVGSKGFPSADESNLGLPFGSPYVVPPLPTLTDVPLRSHRVSFDPSDIELEIVATILPGELKAPVTFTSP